MSSHPLVSVCSPCYNVAPYIGKFLDSLLQQTYKHLQVILVDDGCTDRTPDIIESYLPRLRAEGYEVLVIHQENGGQSAAIQTGIRAATGEFLSWPDPDDWMAPECIEKCLLFLQEHPEVAMVRSNMEKIEDGSGRSLGLMEPAKGGTHIIRHFFDKLVFSNTWFSAGASMIRLSSFDAVLPNREIFVTRKGGQNWQLLLPLAWSYPCWQMEDILTFYRVRANSHSRSANTLQKRLDYYDMCEESVLQTLARIPGTEAYEVPVRCDYAMKRLTAARRAKNDEARRHLYRQLTAQPQLRQKKLLLMWYMYAPRPLIRLGQSLRKLLRYR